MKKLIYLLLICTLFACEKEQEPRVLVLNNGFDQTKIPFSKTDMNITERVLVSFLDDNDNNVGFEVYSVLFPTVSSSSTGYQVVSTPIPDNAKFLLVIVSLSSNGYCLLEYYADIIKMTEGVNRVTVNEYNSVLSYSIKDQSR